MTSSKLEMERATHEAEKPLLPEMSNDELIEALQRLRRYDLTTMLLAPIVTFGITVTLIVNRLSKRYQPALWDILLPPLLISIGVVIIWRFRVKKGARLLRALVQRKEARALGTLIELYAHQTISLGKSSPVEQSLCALLPHLTPADFQAFTDAQVGQCITIAHQYTKRACLPMLDALERCGDQRAFRKMQSPLLRPVTPFGPKAEVKAAQERCLNTMQARADVETHGASLLRPASANPDTASAELLRAASTTVSTTQQNELLRSAGLPIDADTAQETVPFSASNLPEEARVPLGIRHP